jgi:hypothetical protein
MLLLISKERSGQWYFELGGLISTAPDLSASPLPTDVQVWFGRVYALLPEMGQISFALDFKTAFDYRAGTQMSSPTTKAEKLTTVLYMALRIAERLTRSASKGALPVSSPHDALLAIARVLGEAANDVLIADPYMSQVVINDFALSVREGISLRLLSGDKRTDADLEPAYRAWKRSAKPDLLRCDLLRKASS